MRFLAAVLIILCSCLGSAQQPTQSENSSGHVYDNEQLGFTYQLPAGFEFNRAAEVQFPPGTEGLFRADSASSGSRPDVIGMVAHDASVGRDSLEDFAKKFTESSAGQQGIELIRNVEPIQIAGKLFYQIRMNAHYGTAVTYRAQFFTERRGQFLLWAAATQSQKALEEAVYSLNGILFHDDARDANALSRKTIPVLPGKEIHLSEAESKPFIIRKGVPEYPEGAQGSGRVVLSVIIDPDGGVRDVTIVSGEKPFTAAAFQAVQRYRYRPYIWQAHAVGVRTLITMEFLPPKQSAK